MSQAMLDCPLAQFLLLQGLHETKRVNKVETSLHQPLERSGCTGHKRLLVRASIQ